MPFPELKLLEDSYRHQSELQEHREFIRKRFKDDKGSTVGRVPLALNLDHEETTFSSMGVNPKNKIEALHALHNFIGERGYDLNKKIVDKAATMGTTVSGLKNAF